ncbi:hypothetical protein KI387_013816, partial [Taxus chinensis]
RKKVNFEDETTADNVNTTKPPLVNNMEVSSFATAGVNEGQVDTASTEDLSIDNVELLQSVI